MRVGLAAQVIDAVAAQDEAGLAECFASSVEFRALTPSGVRERSGADETAALITRWFADTNDLHLLGSDNAEVGDRLHISYRFEGVEDGEAYVVEQHLFCTINEGRIVRADLLCSGFRPPSASETP